jgi:hypothetical protein
MAQLQMFLLFPWEPYQYRFVLRDPRSKKKKTTPNKIDDNTSKKDELGSVDKAHIG